jgi:hypothetical protein
MARSREMQEAPFAEHNAIGVFPDMVAARKAMDALERGGIDAVHISLLGPRAEEASSRADTRERDENVAVDVGKRAGIGAAAGTAAGGIAGLIAGALAFAIPGVGPVIGAGVWAAAAGGAVAGGAVGGVIGGISAVGLNEAWELTYQSVRAGRVLVGVHSDDRGDVDRGADILREHGALSVDRFDRGGRRLGDKGLTPKA